MTRGCNGTQAPNLGRLPPRSDSSRQFPASAVDRAAIGIGASTARTHHKSVCTAYQGESWMLDSSEGVCPGQARFEYPATSVLFSKRSVSCLALVTAWSRKQLFMRMWTSRAASARWPTLGTHSASSFSV
jgi:hypothetical protein